MATVHVSLPARVWEHSANISSYLAPGRQVKQSSAAVPSPRWIEILFDASFDEHAQTSFFVPNDYVGTPTLKIFYKALSATTGTVGFEVKIRAITADDAQDLDADAYATTNAGTETIPATAGYLGMLEITLTNADSMAAGDFVTMQVNRDVSADDVSSDIEFVGAVFTYANA